MRVTLACCAALLAGPAPAQDWVLQAIPESGTGATACAPGGGGGAVTAFCLSIACPGGRRVGAELSVSEGAPKDAVSARVEVDGATAGVLEFRREPGGGTWSAPLDGQDALLAALREGSGAVVRLDWKIGGLERPLGLSGSDSAIGEVLASCPMGSEAPMSAEALGLDVRVFEDEDPVGNAIAANAAFCAAREVTVEPGLVRMADLDADGVNDAIIDWGSLTCAGSRAFCGSGGCTTEIWLGHRDGTWRRLVSGLIEAIELPAPGRVLIRLDGGACGRAGAEGCDALFAVEEGGLVPAE